MSQFRVGLTGGIGSGKSTVARHFSESGICVVDADEVARRIVEPGSAALAQITAHFGQQILQADGSLNRSALRALIFADPTEKNWLNQLLHPKIRMQMLADLDNATSPYVILMAPLLLENQLDLLVDQVLVVDVSEQTQLERATARDNSSPALIHSIMASQCSRAERLAKASQLIDNEGQVSQLRQQVLALHQQYLQMAEEKLAKSQT